MPVLKKWNHFLPLIKKTVITRKLEFCTEARSQFRNIPGPKSLPVVGTLYQYFPFIGNYSFDKLHINGLKKFKKYGYIVREEIVKNVNVIWLFKPSDIETLFRVEGKYPQRRSHLALEKYRLDRPHIYNTGGLLPTNGPEWFRIRSAFQRGLSSPLSVLNFLPPTVEVIDNWLERIDELRYETDYDFLPEISRLFLELTCMTALDIRLNCFSKTELDSKSKSSKLMDAALISNSCILKTDNGPQLWQKYNTPLYTKFSRAQQYMESVAVELLSQKLTYFKEIEPNKPKTLLENYLSSPDVDFKDIAGMICDFLLAGIDTSAYTVSFIFYYLANNPNVQDKLYEECRILLPRWEDPVTKEVLSKAQYTKAVLKESLRLRPVSVGVGRILPKDAVFSGYHVPKETVVVSQNQVSCRFEEYFSKPNDFIPERWLKPYQDLQKSVHPFLVLPFGHGPRSCIARWLAEQNMRTLLLKITRRFEMRWNSGVLDSKSLLINKPNGPIKLIFVKRKE